VCRGTPSRGILESAKEDSVCPKADRLTPEFTWKHRRARVSKTIFKKRNKFGRLALPDFKISCAVVTQTTDSWWRTDTRTSGVDREPGEEPRASQLIFL